MVIYTWVTYDFVWSIWAVYISVTSPASCYTITITTRKFVIAIRTLNCKSESHNIIMLRCLILLFWYCNLYCFEQAPFYTLFLWQRNLITKNFLTVFSGHFISSERSPQSSSLSQSQRFWMHFPLLQVNSSGLQVWSVTKLKKGWINTKCIPMWKDTVNWQFPLQCKLSWSSNTKESV